MQCPEDPEDPERDKFLFTFLYIFFGKRKLIPIKYANFVQYKDMFFNARIHTVQRVLMEEVIFT